MEHNRWGNLRLEIIKMFRIFALFAIRCCHVSFCWGNCHHNVKYFSIFLVHLCFHRVLCLPHEADDSENRMKSPRWLVIVTRNGRDHFFHDALNCLFYLFSPSLGYFMLPCLLSIARQIELRKTRMKFLSKINFKRFILIFFRLCFSFQCFVGAFILMLF